MRRIREIVLVMFAAAAAYWPGLRGPAVYDDDAFIGFNPRVEDGQRLLRSFWDPSERSEGAGRYVLYPYRPVSEASLFLVRFFGGGLSAQRVLSLALHVGAALAVLALARRLSCPGPLWAALLFALHPLAHQAVGYVAQRAVAIEALLAFLCLLGYLTARDGGGRRPYLGALACALLACGAKETAVLLPLLLGFLEWLLHEPGECWRPALKRWLPFAVLACLVPLQVWRAFGGGSKGVDPQGVFSTAEYLRRQGGILWGYGGLHLFPFHSGGIFPGVPWETGEEGLAAWLPLAGIGGLLLFVLFGPGRWRVGRLCLGLVLLPQALESGLVPLKYLASAYRCYPGLLGAALAFGWLVCRSGARIIALACLAFLGILTFRESSRWAHSEELFPWQLRQSPSSPTLRARRAWGSLEHGQSQIAEEIFREVLAGRQSVRLAEAGLLLSQGKHVTFQDSPFPSEALFIAPMLKAAGRLEEAEGVLRITLNETPWVAGLWDELGVVLTKRGKDAEAEEVLRKALALDPDLAQGHNDLAAVLALQARLGEAEVEVRRALALRPEYGMAWTNLAILFETEGRKAEAAAARERAAACPPDPRLVSPP